MNWTTECCWALLRAFLTATLALGAGAALCRLLRSAHPRLRAAAWALLPVPWLTPVPVVGYAYANCALALVRHPVLNLLFYHLILCLRLAPVAALALASAPSEMSDSALHCHRLLRARSGRVGHGLFRLRAAARPSCAAFCLVFLMAFAEFELATLMCVKTWTVRLFDAHAVAGVPITESLRLVALPGALEALVLLGVYLLLAGARRPADTLPRAEKGTGVTMLGAGVLAAALIVVTVIPFALVAKDAVAGIPALLRRFAIGRELCISVCFAAAAALLAWVLSKATALRFSGVGNSHSAIRAPQFLLAWLLSLPGLLGALVLSLVLLGLFMLPGLRGLYDKPYPLAVGLTLLLLPFAMVMRMLFRAHSAGSGLFAATMLRNSGSAPVRRRGGRLARFIRARGRFWAVFLLFSLAYFDLTVSSILARPGDEPVFVRLYNLMHYGGSAVLSANVMVAFAVPVLLLAVAAAGRGMYNRMNGNA